MAIADRDTELASVPRWGVTLTARFVAGLFLWGVVFVAFSAPALHAVPIAYAPSTPFLWLTIVGLIIGISSPNLNEDDEDFIGAQLESYQNKDRSEKFIFVLTFMMLLVGGVSFEVAVVGVAATLLAQQTALGLIAVAIPLWYPSVDSWLGRKLGWNVASTGGLAALLLMVLLAKMYRVSPEVPRSAAVNLRNNLTGH